MRPCLIALLVVGAAIPSIAQVPGAPDRARVQAGGYTLDADHTQVLFTVSHLGFSEYTGQFTQPTGTLTLDPAHPDQAKVEVVFPIAKVSTTAPGLDKHLQNADFFDAAKFPEGRFVSTKVTVAGDRAMVAGNLTLKGVTKPVVLQTRFYGAGNGRGKDTIGFQATTTIKRSEYGISYGVPAISDDVKLTINAAFTR